MSASVAAFAGRDADRGEAEVLGQAHRPHHPPARRAWSWRSRPSPSIRRRRRRRGRGRGLRRTGRGRRRSVCKANSARSAGLAAEGQGAGRPGWRRGRTAAWPRGPGHGRLVARNCRERPRPRGEGPGSLEALGPGPQSPFLAAPDRRGVSRRSRRPTGRRCREGLRSLWAEKAADPAPAAAGSKATLPRAWTASTWRRGGARPKAAAASAIAAAISRYGLDRARLVVDRHHRDEGAVLLDGGGDLARDRPCRRASGATKLTPMPERLEQEGLLVDGGVLDLRRDEMEALDAPVAAGVEGRPQQGEERNAVGFGAAARERESAPAASRCTPADLRPWIAAASRVRASSSLASRCGSRARACSKDCRSIRPRRAPASARISGVGRARARPVEVDHARTAIFGRGCCAAPCRRRRRPDRGRGRRSSGRAPPRPSTRGAGADDLGVGLARAV